MGEYTLPVLPKPRNDLRNQLVDSLVRTGLRGLSEHEARLESAVGTDTLDRYRDAVRGHIRKAFGPMPFGKQGAPLQTQSVSTHDTRYCRIENVLFDSYPGWEVNATLYVPKGSGLFPAIILPVGHSGKQFENYQIPAQAFASLGFIAVSFDPPGQSSEKQRGNDHFRDGVRSLPFGITANRFFVLDALRCIDYLESRNDVDLSRGVAMSGVSGGGITTLYASLFDDRVVCFGPSCCMNPMADHPVGDGYSACPEGFWHGRLAQGIDNTDVALACAPKPMIYMYGKYDEVFHADASRKLVSKLADCYSTGDDEHFSSFEDESGHAYTLQQTAVFSTWVRRWMLGEKDPTTPSLRREDFELLDYDMIKCRPSQDVNMFTIHRDLAAEFRNARKSGIVPSGTPSGAPSLSDIRRVTGQAPKMESWTETHSFRIWSQEYREALCQVDSFDVPVSVLRPSHPLRAEVNLIYIDDRGRKHALESAGPVTGFTRMIERDPSLVFPAVYVPDLPGWGESEQSVTPYQLAAWGSMDRLLAYLSYANGDGVLAILARIAAAIADDVSHKSALPAGKTIIAGSGLGGIVAILAAAASDSPLHAIAIDSLASFELLLSEEFYTWPSISFLPNALNHFDIPEAVEALRSNGRRVLIVNPMDGRSNALDKMQAKELFQSEVIGGDEDPRNAIQQFIDSVARPESI